MSPWIFINSFYNPAVFNGGPNVLETIIVIFVWFWNGKDKIQRKVDSQKAKWSFLFRGLQNGLIDYSRRQNITTNLLYM